MSDLYSDVEANFYLDSCATNKNELNSVLKGEVGLVQATRRTTKIINRDDFGEHGGAGDSQSKVVKMEGSILKGDCTTPEEDDLCDFDIKQESVTLLKAFCIQNGIAVLPEDVGRQHNNKNGHEKASGSHHHHHREGRKHSGTAQNESGQGGTESHRNPDGGNPGGVGGSGGGKRPPPPPSSSEPELSRNDTSDSENDEDHPSTARRLSSIKDVGRQRNVREKKSGIHHHHRVGKKRGKANTQDDSGGIGQESNRSSEGAAGTGRWSETNEVSATDEVELTMERLFGDGKERHHRQGVMNSKSRPHVNKGESATNLNEKSRKKHRPGGSNLVPHPNWNETSLDNDENPTSASPTSVISGSSSSTSLKQHQQVERQKRHHPQTWKPYIGNVHDVANPSANANSIVSSNSLLKRKHDDDRVHQHHHAAAKPEPPTTLVGISKSRISVRHRQRGDVTERRKHHYVWDSNEDKEQVKEPPGKIITIMEGPVHKKRKQQYKRDSFSTRRKKQRRRMLPHPESHHHISDLKHIARLIKNERDTEWLNKWTGSEDEEEDKDEKNAKKVKINSKSRSIQPDLGAFMTSSRLLNRIEFLMGLDPFRKTLRNNQSITVKWVPGSKRFFRLCANAMLFLMITLSLFFSLVIDIFYNNSLTDTYKVVKQEFAQHFIEAFFLMLQTLFLSVWSVSCILELGPNYAKFYSRFNLGICLTKYDVTDGIHEMIHKHLAIVFIFKFLTVILFFEGYFYSSIVREGCGFLGFSILRPFNFELRESIYFPLVEFFGLVTFLYCFFSMSVVIIHFMVYARTLGNMAKCFNLRMAYALGNLSEIHDDGVTKTVKKVVPFRKLWAEHQIIASLFRNISQVNFVVFGSLLFSLVFQISLVLWLILDIYLDDDSPSLDGLSVDRSGRVDLAVPLRPQKTKGERFLKAFVITAITWLTYWIFGGVLHHAGEVMQNGIYYIRRCGLVLCKKSKERRFVLSMMNSFYYERPYWIGRQFQFSRIFLVGLMNFVIGASMVVVAFRPDRLTLTSIETCDDQGQCIVIKLYKIVANIVYTTLDVTPPSVGVTKPPVIVTSTNPPLVEAALDEHYPRHTFLLSPPFISSGAYPVHESVVVETVYSEWSYPFSQLKLPLVYQYKTIPDPSAVSSPKNYLVYEGRTILKPLIDGLFSSYGVDIRNPPGMDDCGCPSFVTPKKGDLTVKGPSPPEKQLIAVNQIPGYPDLNDERFFCCYKYAIDSENEVKVCNMPNKTEIDKRCRLSAEDSSEEVARSAQALKEKRRSGKGRDDLASSVPFNDPVRSSWTKCLCYNEIKECKVTPSPTSTTPPTTPPPTPPTTPPTTPPPTPPPVSDSRCFTKCQVPSKTGEWAQLDYVSYPFMYQGKFVQKLRILNDCKPVGAPLPMDISDTVDPNQSVYDCADPSPNEYSHETSYFEDSCLNPILHSRTGTWNKLLKLHIVYLNSERVLCCVNYQLPNSAQSQRQAKVCSRPKNVVKLEQQCPEIPNSDSNRPLLVDSYTKKWSQLKNQPSKLLQLETNDYLVRCMCGFLLYVKKKYPSEFPDGKPHPPVIHADCVKYINNFN